MTRVGTTVVVANESSDSALVTHPGPLIARGIFGVFPRENRLMLLVICGEISPRSFCPYVCGNLHTPCDTPPRNVRKCVRASRMAACDDVRASIFLLLSSFS